jgi:SAM-dependent methyltransferase
MMSDKANFGVVASSCRQDPAALTERNIAVWDQLFTNRNWGKYPPEELVRFIARTFPEIENRKLLRALEVGCGPGANLWYLAREGFKIAGIDGSAKAIGLVRERLRAEKLNIPYEVDLRVGNFATLPWAANQFDVVIDIEAISCNTTPVIRSVIAEIKRVLKSGGWFFAKMFGPKTTGATSGSRLEVRTTEKPLRGPLAGMGVTHVFTEREIRKEFSGFAEFSLDWVYRSDRNGQFSVFEWLVQARK